MHRHFITACSSTLPLLLGVNLPFVKRGERWLKCPVDQCAEQTLPAGPVVDRPVAAVLGRPFTVSLFRLPQTRRLSCGTVRPDRTHSSPLTFMRACSLERELFMLHCVHRPQWRFNSQPLGSWDLLCVTVLWVRESSPQRPVRISSGKTTRIHSPWLVI